MASIQELNTLRVTAGMKPLKAWKESKAKLEAAIAKLQTVKPAAGSPGPELLAQLFPISPTVAKPTVKTKAIAIVAKKTQSDTKPVGVSISTIADELDMLHKVARNKLRKAGNKVPTCVKGTERWMFDKKDVAAVKAILSTDKRKK